MIDNSQSYIDGSKTLFIDNSQSYIDGARSVGINSILYQGTKKLREDLKKFGL